MVQQEKDTAGHKRQRILEATGALVMEHGLQSTPMSLIANHAQVAIGTVYTYFDSKQDLVCSLYRQLIDNMTDAVMEGSQTESPVHERFLSYWSRLLDYMLTHQKQASLLLYLTTTPYIDESFREKTSARLVEFHSLIIREGRDTKQIKDISTTIFNWFLYGSMMFIVNKVLVKQTLTSDKDLNNRIIKMWWDSIRR
ncbi:MAG: TetR/AcrR family transcriptional regulator [Dehalococcoidia bacterium]